MDRRTFLGSLTGSLLAAPLAAEAQPAGKVFRLGLLDASTPDSARLGWWKAFEERMGDLGYVEGKTVIFERRWAHGESERAPALAAELVGLRVDIIVTASAPALLAAKAATGTIPIVMALVGDPVELKVVSSLARPGGNVTGLASISSDLSGKRLALVKELLPRASRVAVLWDLGNPGAALAVKDTAVAAKALGVVLQNLGVRMPHEVEAAFSTMTTHRAEALIMIPSPLFFPERRRLAQLALAKRLPLITGLNEYAEAGGLMSYGAQYRDLFGRAAAYVDKILKGAKPGELPIEQPTRFELVINLKTAKALGLTIPPSLLQRADQVIE